MRKGEDDREIEKETKDFYNGDCTRQFSELKSEN